MNIHTCIQVMETEFPKEKRRRKKEYCKNILKFYTILFAELLSRSISTLSGKLE